MSGLDPDTIRHLLTVARRQGLAEADIHVGEDSFWAVFESAPTSPSSGTVRGAAVVSDVLAGLPSDSAIHAPFVGYYRANDPPLQVGQRVEKGEIVASVAALGLAHDVESPCTGEVTELLVEPGQPVEFGQALARVKAI